MQLLLLFPTTAAMLQWSSLATAWLGRLGSIQGASCETQDLCEGAQISHNSDPLSPFPKTLLLHLLPTALSSSESDSSAVFATSSQHLCTVWPEMFLLDICQREHLHSTAEEAGKGRVGLFSHPVWMCTCGDKELAHVTLALLPEPLKAVPL